MEKKNKRGDKKNVTQGADFVKFIQNPPTQAVWSCRKNEKPKNAKTNGSSYNGKNKGKKTTTKEMETRGGNLSTSKYNGNTNRQAMATERRE